jgi:hypothetical protein
MLNLQDKIILVSKRKIDNDGNESFDTYFGKVLKFNGNTVVVSKLNGGKESLPYDDDFYVPAEDGYYELNDGSTFENPDYIAEFVVYQSAEARQKHRELNPE